jgi:hypothetical protein
MTLTEEEEEEDDEEEAPPGELTLEEPMNYADPHWSVRYHVT